MRVYGFASCAVQGGRGAASSSMRREALVNSTMATYWVVDSISYLGPSPMLRRRLTLTQPLGPCVLALSALRSYICSSGTSGSATRF
jgi:hypothetical protein